jgi:hypothetical protein
MAHLKSRSLAPAIVGAFLVLLRIIALFIRRQVVGGISLGAGLESILWDGR